MGLGLENEFCSILEWNMDTDLYTKSRRDVGLAPGMSGWILSDDIIRAVLITLAQNLHALHKKGLAHGKIRPENILIDAQGNIKLLEREHCPSDLLPSGGTPKPVDILRKQLQIEFCPPEANSEEVSANEGIDQQSPKIVTKPQAASPEGDMWQVGMTLSCMLFGQPRRIRSRDISESEGEDYLQERKGKTSAGKYEDEVELNKTLTSKDDASNMRQGDYNDYEQKSPLQNKKKSASEIRELSHIKGVNSSVGSRAQLSQNNSFAIIAERSNKRE